MPGVFRLKSSTDSVATPDCILDSLKAEFGELYDPCPLCDFDPKIHKDGLTTDWGDVSFCNPPFSMTSKFVIKAHKEWTKGKTIIVLVKNTITNSKYFKKYCAGTAEIRFISNKIKFKGYSQCAWFPIILLVFYKNKMSNIYKCVTYDDTS